MFKKIIGNQNKLYAFFSVGRELCSDRNDISLPPPEYF